MAEVTTTAANIAFVGSTASTSYVQYGETIVPPQPAYLLASKYYAADSNVGVAEAAVTMILMTPGVADQYGVGITAGTIDIGGTTVKGKQYILGPSKGWLPDDEHGSGEYRTNLGVASDTVGTIVLDIEATGIVK